MMKKPFAYFLTKKFYCPALIVLGATYPGTGCQKLKPSNPCEGLLGEKSPTHAALTFIDGQTGENILLSKNIDAANIIITQEGTDGRSEPCRIVKESGAPTYGALVFYVADTKKGAFKYKITLPNLGSTTLSYINEEKKSDNKCKPYYINVTDPVIEDHQFTVIHTGNLLVLKVTL